MFARVARYEVEPDRTGEAIEAFREAVQQLEGLNGLKGGYVLADWEDGVIMSMTIWENRAVMDESEAKAAALRQTAAKAVDGTVVSVHNLDVALEIGAAVSSDHIAAHQRGLRRSSSRTSRRRYASRRGPSPSPAGRCGTSRSARSRRRAR